MCSLRLASKSGQRNRTAAQSIRSLAARGKSRAGAKNGDCHQFAPRHDPRNKALSLKRIGWLYQIFRDLHFYHGLLG